MRQRRAGDLGVIEIERSQLLQACEVLYTRRGDRSFGQVEPRQARQLSDGRQARIADFRVIEVQLFQPRQAAQRLDVGHSSRLEDQRLEVFEAGQLVEVAVRGAGAAKVEPAELLERAQPAERRQARIMRQTQHLQPLQLRQVNQTLPRQRAVA